MPIDFKKVNNILRVAKSFIEMSQTEGDLTEEKINEVINQEDAPKLVEIPAT